MNEMSACMGAQLNEMPDFGMEDFDFDAAFQGAAYDVATNEELALDEKVRRMENIVSEAGSELYQGLVDFRALAAQMEMICSHDHSLRQELQNSEPLSSFFESHGSRHGDSHDHDSSQNNEYEIDPKTGKRRKKKKKEEAGSFLEGIFKKNRNRTARQAGRSSLFSHHKTPDFSLGM